MNAGFLPCVAVITERFLLLRQVWTPELSALYPGLLTVHNAQRVVVGSRTLSKRCEQSLAWRRSGPGQAQW